VASAVQFPPTAQRRALRVAYCFFRTADDLVDVHGYAPDQLRAWCAEALRPASEQTDPVLLAWADLRNRYTINADLVRDLLAGIALDAEQRRFETRSDLESYCYQVASTAGLMITPIVGLQPGVTFAQAAPLAVKLGLALQLTNILRDVREDFEHGRLYLPLNDLAEAGVSETDLPQAAGNVRVRALVRALARLADGYYCEAWPGIKMLAAPANWAVGLGAAVYRAYLGAIRRQGYDVIAQRPRPSAAMRGYALVTGIRAMIRGTLSPLDLD
jgi:phytoene synthase